MDDQASLSSVGLASPAQLAFRVPHPRLAGSVVSYTGWDWTLARPLRRRVTALDSVLVAIDFEPSARSRAVNARGPELRPVLSPVIGLRGRPMEIERVGRVYGVTMQLTAPGARALFGLPLQELTDLCVSLTDLLGAGARRLAEQLAEAPDWSARFRLLDSYLITRISAGPELPLPLRRAWQRLTALSGDVRIGTLADEVGWSRQHLNARFRQEIGSSPKTVARIARMQRAVCLSCTTGWSSWADVAAASGYADQPHLNRDFRTLAGLTPTAYHALATEWRGVLTGSPLIVSRQLRANLPAAGPLVANSLVVLPGGSHIAPAIAHSRPWTDEMSEAVSSDGTSDEAVPLTEGYASVPAPSRRSNL
ncbi:helix-turn-helix domain-containing protein [Streptomyces gamaensis]|uniref:Helix-turn-helix domain-containing protein n=1 Tax=Streptomyces gamaensis TaxID=1763542 RepID=A0ABW0ZC94_9ACTN